MGAAGAGRTDAASRMAGQGLEGRTATSPEGL